MKEYLNMKQERALLNRIKTIWSHWPFHRLLEAPVWMQVVLHTHPPASPAPEHHPTAKSLKSHTSKWIYCNKCVTQIQPTNLLETFRSSVVWVWHLIDVLEFGAIAAHKFHLTHNGEFQFITDTHVSREHGGTCPNSSPFRSYKPFSNTFPPHATNRLCYRGIFQFITDTH